VAYCQQAGLVSGKENNLFDPSADSTRAEGCAVFSRLIKAILGTQSQ
jgi:hypothetical protein